MGMGEWTLQPSLAAISNSYPLIDDIRILQIQSHAGLNLRSKIANKNIQKVGFESLHNLSVVKLLANQKEQIEDTSLFNCVP